MTPLSIALFIALFVPLAPSILFSDSQTEALDDMIRKPVLSQTTQSSVLREQIAALNYSSMIIEERSWSCWSYYEFLCKSFQAQAEPLIQERRNLAFKIINSTTHASTSIIKEPVTWQDLNMFAGKRPGENYVGNILCRTKTEIGRVQFYSLLAANTADSQEIIRRQNIIKLLLAKPTFCKEISTQLNTYANSEDLFLSHWQTDQYAQNITKNYCFNDPVLKYFNNSTVAIQVKNLYANLNLANQLASNTHGITGLALCLLAAIIDQTSPKSKDLLQRARQQQQNNLLNKYLWDHGPNAIKYGLTALSCYFLATWTQHSINDIVDNLMFEEIIHLKLQHVARIFRSMRNLAMLLQKEKQLLSLLPELKAIQILFTTTEEQNAPLHELIHLILSDVFAEDSSADFASRGTIMLSYIGLNTLKDSLLPALQAFSLIDAYCGVAQFMEEKSEQFCFVEFQNKEAPYLHLEQFINPLVLGRKNNNDDTPPQPPVANTIELGQDAPSRNCVITGPNAGGKSTLIKAIGINVLLAQSIGIAAAKRCILTPFSFVATYLNITDDINSGNSLFKAEVLRTQELINNFAALPPGQYGLLIFDEVFNGTTPLEGSAAAYAVAEFLGNMLNGITIVATHFEQLTKLELQPEGGYKNYKVSVVINNDGSLSYPFTISRGISQQHIALDILRNEGYSGAIVTRTANLLGKA